MRLAAITIPAGADTLLHTVPADSRAIVTLSLCNRSAAPAKVRVAFTSGDVPTTADWIEFDTPLPSAGTSGGSTLERTGLAMAAGDRLYVRSDVVGVSAVAYGVQEPI